MTLHFVIGLTFTAIFFLYLWKAYKDLELSLGILVFVKYKLKIYYYVINWLCNVGYTRQELDCVGRLTKCQQICNIQVSVHF